MTSYKLWVSIPDLYPKIAPTIMITTKECNDKDFQLALEKVVTEIVSLGFKWSFKFMIALKFKIPSRKFGVKIWNFEAVFKSRIRWVSNHGGQWLGYRKFWKIQRKGRAGKNYKQKRRGRVYSALDLLSSYLFERKAQKHVEFVGKFGSHRFYFTRKTGDYLRWRRVFKSSSILYTNQKVFLLQWKLKKALVDKWIAFLVW